MTEFEYEFVKAATLRFRERLVELVADHEEAGLDLVDVLGDPVEFGRRAADTLVPLPSPWDELVGPFTASEGVQARLGITRQAVASKAARRRLLRVITSDDVHLYPIWQFEGGAVVAGLPEVLSLFPEDAVDGWTLAGWLRTADPDLGEAPIDAIVRGDLDRVLPVARTASRALAG